MKRLLIVITFFSIIISGSSYSSSLKEQFKAQQRDKISASKARSNFLISSLQKQINLFSYIYKNKNRGFQLFFPSSPPRNCESYHQGDYPYLVLVGSEIFKMGRNSKKVRYNLYDGWPNIMKVGNLSSDGTVKLINLNRTLKTDPKFCEIQLDSSNLFDNNTAPRIFYYKYGQKVYKSTWRVAPLFSARFAIRYFQILSNALDDLNKPPPDYEKFLSDYFFKNRKLCNWAEDVSGFSKICK